MFLAPMHARIQLNRWKDCNALPDGVTTISLWGTNLTDKRYIANMLWQGGDVPAGGVDPSLGWLLIIGVSPEGLE